MEDLLNKPRYSHTLEYKAAVKRNEIYLYNIMDWSSGNLSRKDDWRKVCIIRKDEACINTSNYLLINKKVRERLTDF